MYPVKNGLSTEVKCESFDDEAFETGNRNQFSLLIYLQIMHVNTFFDSFSVLLPCCIQVFFFQNLISTKTRR